MVKKDEKKKILQVIQSNNFFYTQGGQEYLFFLLNLKLLESEKYDITILCPGYNPLLKKLEKFNIKFHFYDLSKFKLLFKFSDLKKILKKEQFDIIHTHDIYSNFLIFLLKNYTKFSITTRYDILYSRFMTFTTKIKKFFIKFIEKIICNFNDYNVVVSKNILSEYLNYNIPNYKLKEIAPAVNYSQEIDKNKINEIKKNVLNIASSEKKIFCLTGNFNILKLGYDIFIDAIQYIDKKYGLNNEPYVFAIYGNKYKELYEYLTQRNMLNKINVIDNSYSPNNLMAAIDVLVLPLRYDGFPLILLRSQKYNKPVIATDVGAVTEIVHNNKNGYIVPVADSVELAEKIHLLGNNNEKYNEMVKYIKENKNVFSEEIMTEKYMTLYDKLLK